MTNIRFTRIEEYDDIDTRNHYRKLLREGGDTEQFLREQQEIGRDNARTSCGNTFRNSSSRPC